MAEQTSVLVRFGICFIQTPHSSQTVARISLPQFVRLAEQRSTMPTCMLLLAVLIGGSIVDVDVNGSTQEMENFRRLTHRLLQAPNMKPYATLKASSEEVITSNISLSGLHDHPPRLQACNQLCNADTKCAAGDWSMDTIGTWSADNK